MALSLLFNRKAPQFLQPVEIEGAIEGGADPVVLLELDASLNEEHVLSTEVTTFPVEDGANISDHAHQQPEKLRLTGFITNAPVKWLGGIRNRLDRIESGRTRVQGALDMLMAMAGYQSIGTEAGRFDYSGGTPQLVDIITGLRVYSDMILTSLTIPRDSKTGESMQFTAELMKLRRVESSTSPVLHTTEKKSAADGTNTQAAPEIDKGTETVKAPTERTKSIWKLYNGAASEGTLFDFKQPFWSR